MKQFKNTFGILCENPHLIAAFVQMAKDLGWGDQTDGRTFTPGIHVGMWFCDDSNTNQALKANHFWFCNSINTRSKKDTIYTLPAQWDDAVKAVSELMPAKEIKEGDWVVVLPTDSFYSNAEQGIAQEVNRVIKEDDLPYKLKFSNGATNSYKEVRLATEEEIAHAKRLTDKTVTLEKSGRTVNIKGSGVCVAAGSAFGIEEVYKLRKMVGKVSTASTGWVVVIDSVSVGCTSGITMADLDNIIKAYESCKA
jgi:hypothetical protein